MEDGQTVDEPDEIFDSHSDGRFEQGMALRAVPVLKLGFVHVVRPNRLKPLDDIIVVGMRSYCR